jgi:hypothetical protein
MTAIQLYILLAVAVMFVAAFFTVAVLFADWLHDHRLRPRARTCGTCAYCEPRLSGPEGICCRSAYVSLRYPYDEKLLRRAAVQLDWRGCGESEERT